MSASIKMTSKRQVTFPAGVCKDLGVEPGDLIDLIPKTEDGERYWLLQKHQFPARPWVGILHRYARNAKDHSLEAIRETIREKRSS